MITKPSLKKSKEIHTVNLKNQNGKVFYNKFTYIYLEMPNFKRAKMANYSPMRLDNYENSLKTYRDLKGVIDTDFDEGNWREYYKLLNLLKTWNCDRYYYGCYWIV